MNHIDIILLVSGLLQLGVAWCVLRLVRLFRTTVKGWVLFGALALLALLNLFLAVEPVGAITPWGSNLGILGALVSLLLFAGALRFYSSLKNFLQAEGAERLALDKWESQVKEQWVELIKANEKLRENVGQLESEMGDCKRAQSDGEEKLQALLAALREKETALREKEVALREKEAALSLAKAKLEAEASAKAASLAATDSPKEIIENAPAPVAAESQAETIEKSASPAANSKTEVSKKPALPVSTGSPPETGQPAQAPVAVGSMVEPREKAPTSMATGSRIKIPRPNIVPPPMPAQKNGASTPAAPPEDVEETPLVISNFGEEVIEEESKPILMEEDDPCSYDEEPAPAIAGLDTAIFLQKLDMEPDEENDENGLAEAGESFEGTAQSGFESLEKNGRQKLAVSGENLEESPRSDFVVERNIVIRKIGGTPRKKLAKAHTPVRVQSQKRRPASIRNAKVGRAKASRRSR